MSLGFGRSKRAMMPLNHWVNGGGRASEGKRRGYGKKKLYRFPVDEIYHIISRPKKRLARSFRVPPNDRFE